IRDFHVTGVQTCALPIWSSEFFFYDYTAKLLFDLNENHKFRANIIGINNNLDYKENYTNNNNQTESKTSNLSQENMGAGAHWSRSEERRVGRKNRRRGQT